MFFKKDKKNKKPEILMKENILLNCKPDTPENVIKKVGKIFVDCGYVTEKYVEGMLARDKEFSVAIGNEIAIPHGEGAVRKEVINSGLVVMTFPEGIDWHGENVRIVVGIAGVGDEHLDILANIAETMSTPEEVDKAIKSNSVDYIYNIFTEKRD